MNNLIAKRFLITDKQGAGSFGSVYKGIDIVSKQNVAIKLEIVKADNNTLKREYYCYKQIYDDTSFVPKIYYYGYYDNDDIKYRVIVLDCLGPSIRSIMREQDNRFSLKSSIMIGFQLIQRIKYIHSRNIIHRDIKPDNFLTGLRENRHIIYLIDFGLSKDWVPHSKEPSHDESFDTLIGTIKYSSKYSNLYTDLSKRDDLISAIYCIIFFIKGSLPWDKMDLDEKLKYKKIYDMKNTISSRELCEGAPIELAQILDYCHSLEYADEPNYDYILDKLSNVFISNTIGKFDWKFDWL